MKFNKKVSEVVRDLNNLSIDFEGRIKLVKGCYGCIGLMFGFDKNLKYNISEAYKKGLNGEKAYDFLENGAKDYDAKISKSFIQREITFD